MNIQKVMLAQALNPESNSDLLSQIVKVLEEHENIFIAISRNPNTKTSDLARISYRYANYVVDNPLLPLLALGGRFEELDNILLSRGRDEVYDYGIPMIHFIHDMPDWIENYIMSGFSQHTHELAYWVKLEAGSKRFTIWCQEKKYDALPF